MPVSFIMEFVTHSYVQFVTPLYVEFVTHFYAHTHR